LRILVFKCITAPLINSDCQMLKSIDFFLRRNLECQKCQIGIFVTSFHLALVSSCFNRWRTSCKFDGQVDGKLLHVP